MKRFREEFNNNSSFHLVGVFDTALVLIMAGVFCLFLCSSFILFRGYGVLGFFLILMFTGVLHMVSNFIINVWLHVVFDTFITLIAMVRERL